VLWLAHRDFLLHDARKAISALTNEYIDLEKASWHCGDSRIIVASVQTLKGDRLTRKPRDMFSLIITDEAHHGTAASYRAIYDHFESAKLLHITATPKRADGTGLWNISESHCDPFGIESGLEWGSCVPIVPVSEFIDKIDLSKIKTQAGDLALGELEEQIVESAASIAQLTAKHMTNRQCITFTPGVASAHAVAATLREMGYGAAAIDADTEDRQRIAILRDFREKSLQYIVNCAILTEGFDAPTASGVCIARPTKSEALYTQMAGRGLRPEGWIGDLKTAQERQAAIAASGKPNCLLLDISGRAGRHSLCSATDLLGGKRIREAVEAVKEKIAKGQGDGKSLDELLDEEEKSIKQQEEESRKKIAQAARAAEVKSRQSTFDPLVKLGFDERNHGDEPNDPGLPASKEDVEWLKKNALPFKNVTRGMVAKFRSQAAKWRRDGLASWKMRSVLSRAKLDVEMPFSEAGAVIGYMKERGDWQPKPETVERIRKIARESGREVR